MLTAIHIGADPVLLWSRAAILEMGGLSVVSAEGLAQALDHIWGVPFDLVILCHSLPSAHRAQVIAAARRRSPSVPILLVAGGFGAGTAKRDGIDFVIDSEPHRLLQNLQRILRLPEEDCSVPPCKQAAGHA